MKTIKKLFSFLLVFIMLAALTPATVDAAAKDTIPTKVRFYYYQSSNAITINLADMTQSIGNVTTNSKNLTAMITGSDYNSQQSDGYDDPEAKNQYRIGLRRTKEGTYTVSFDILDENNKKVETKKIKVYAYSRPVKSITFDGKEIDNELSGKSAKVKVALTSGNTIKKLEYGVYELEKENEDSIRSEEVYKKFKNGEKVVFGTQPYYYLSQYSDVQDNYSNEYKYFDTDMEAPTYIRITYYDKYTKQNEVITEYYYMEIK